VGGGVGAGAGAGELVEGAGVTLPVPSAVAAAVALVVEGRRRARSRASNPASANCVINMTATIAIAKYFFISFLLQRVCQQNRRSHPRDPSRAGFGGGRNGSGSR